MLAKLKARFGSEPIDFGWAAYLGSLNLRGSSLGFMASGEGLVCEFNGQGRIYIQSRNLSALVGWLTPLMPGLLHKRGLHLTGAILLAFLALLYVFAVTDLSVPC